MIGADLQAPGESPQPRAIPPNRRFVMVPKPLVRFMGIALSTLLLLSVLGYPVVGAGSSLYLVEGRDFAVGFRVLVLLLSVASVGIALVRVPTQALRFLPLPMAALLVLYSVRLIADSLSGQFPDLGEASLYFYGTCAIPTIATCMLASFHVPERDGSLFLIAGGLLCALILVTSQADFGSSMDASQIGEGRLTLTRLNPISIGHAGVTTLVAALAVYFEPGHQRWVKLLIIPAVVVAIICVVAAGSRGPLVSLAGVVVALLVFQRRWSLLAFIVAAIGIWALQATTYDNTLLERLMEVGSDQSSTIRLDLQGLALQEFLDHPVLGSAYVELVTGFNPHNIILESAMALGVVGFALALWICFRVGLTAVRQMSSGRLMLPLMTIQYLIAVQFSGSLSSSNEFWVCAGLILTVAARRGSAPANYGRPALPRRPTES